MQSQTGRKGGAAVTAATPRLPLWGIKPGLWTRSMAAISRIVEAVEALRAAMPTGYGDPTEDLYRLHRCAVAILAAYDALANPRASGQEVQRIRSRERIDEMTFPASWDAERQVIPEVLRKLNAHDALVAACEAALSGFHKDDARHEQLRAALALAKGGA